MFKSLNVSKFLIYGIVCSFMLGFGVLNLKVDMSTNTQTNETVLGIVSEVANANGPKDDKEFKLRHGGTGDWFCCVNLPNHNCTLSSSGCSAGPSGPKCPKPKN